MRNEPTPLNDEAGEAVKRIVDQNPFARPAYRLAEIYPKEVTSLWSDNDIAEAMCDQLTPERNTKLTAGEVVAIREFFSGVIYAYGQRILLDE